MPAVRLRALSEFGADLQQKLYYYRCLGSDAYRHLCGPVCTNRPIRQDYLDQFVWQEIIRVLEEPELIQAEIQRRLEAAQKSDPVRKGEQSLRRERTRLEASTERLLTAYQEDLLTLAELRRRMPELRKQQQAIQSELTSMELAASDQSRYLRLTHYAGGVPPAPSREVRNHGGTGATENSAAPGQGNSRGDRHHYHPAFASDRRIGTAERRSCGWSEIARGAIRNSFRRKLSFAFRECFRHCSVTSCSTNSTGSGSGGDLAWFDTRTTVISTSVASGRVKG